MVDFFGKHNFASLAGKVVLWSNFVPFSTTLKLPGLSNNLLGINVEPFLSNITCALDIDFLVF